VKRALAFGLGLALIATAAIAARPATLSSNAYQVILNGELTRLGVLASTGTSVNNTTTASAFTVTTSSCPSRVLMFDCDGAGHIGNGATCSDDVTNVNYKPQAASHQWKYFTLDSDVASATTTVCLDTPATTVNCVVFCMK
jgi:hypothetical protein